MEIRLYQNFIKKEDSTATPSGTYISKDVRLKEETSVQSPTFLLSDYDSTYNYIFVPKWGRYYFKSDCVLNINGIWELQCKFDHLATYKPSISALTTFIERTSDSRYYDTMIHDSAITALSGIDRVTSKETDAFPSSNIYIIRVMGRGTSNGIGTFVVNYNDIKTIFSGVWGDVDDDNVTDYIKALCNLFINDPAQYIVGVYRSPIGITKYLECGTDDVTIYVGGHETNLKAIRVDQPNTIIFNPHLVKPTNIYTDWRAYDPAFSHYTLYIPTIGVVNLPAEIMNKDLQMVCCADLYSGDLTFMLYADGDIIATFTSNCYASVSVGVQNGSSGSSVLSSALGVAAGISTGSMVVAAPTVINGVQKLISPTSSVIGTQGSLGAVATYPNFIITCTQKMSADTPHVVYGKPCCKVLRIGNLLGYVKCQNASINIAGSIQDKQLVNASLNNGFYYE